MASPQISNFEDIHEDIFNIRFTVETHVNSSHPENLDILIFEVFQSPFIIPCGTVLQDVSEFLRTTVSSYLSERDTHTLASEIISYYQHTAVETASPRLIPLEVHFYTDYAFGQHTPLMYVLQSYEGHRNIIDSELTEIHEAIDQSMQQIYMVPASKVAIATLKKIKKLNEEISADLCSICLEDFDDDADVSAMPCDHVYHNTCILKWLETSHMCPLCRYQMSTE